MANYWVLYTLNGVKHVATTLETLEDAKHLIKKLKHICKAFGWDLTEIVIKQIG